MLSFAFSAISSDQFSSDEFSDDSSNGKALNFREKTLTDKEIKQLTDNAYEEIDLACTNIRKYSLASLKTSQDSLQDLNIEGNALDINDVKNLTSFTNLQILNAANNRFKDSDIESIASSLTNLRNLNIQYNFVTSRGIQHLTKLSHLESLDCGFMDLGNEAIRYISQLQSLKHLFIRSTNIDDGSLEYFLSLPKLEWIDLSYNRINDKQLSDFKSAMKHKKIVADHLIKNRKPTPLSSNVSLIEKELSCDFQHLSLSQKNKSSNPFQEVSLENLKKLVSLLNNSDKSMGYKGISEENLSALCGYSSRTPIRKLLGRFEGNIEQDTFLSIWKKLTGDFDEICKQYDLDKTAILDHYTSNT